MTALQFFRFLVAARIALAAIFRVTESVPWDHQRLSTSLNPLFVLLVELPLIIAAIAITVGLWRFRWWARIGFVAVSLGYAFVAIFFPPPFAHRLLASSLCVCLLRGSEPSGHRHDGVLAPRHVPF
jgi:hypothetical protein